MTTITSRHHPIVSRFREAARAGHDDRVMLLDGPHLVRDALAAGVRIDLAATTGSPQDGTEIAALLPVLRHRGAEIAHVSGAVMDALSPVKTPTGVVALAARPEIDTRDVWHAHGAPLVAAIVGVQDPGNVGAIIRSANAAGASGVIVTRDSANPFGWKALRGAMGSTFRVPVLAGADAAAVLQEASRRGIRTLAAVAGGRTAVYACDLTRPTLLLVGGEGAGLPEAVVAGAQETLHIPMAHGVESLNAGVAAAVILFEASRQRAARRGGPS